MLGHGELLGALGFLPVALQFLERFSEFFALLLASFQHSGDYFVDLWHLGLELFQMLLDSVIRNRCILLAASLILCLQKFIQLALGLL